MNISDKKVASFHYTLKDNSGNILDSSDGQSPLSYIQGMGNIIPGLENALEGKTKGDKLQVTVKPEEAYGNHSPELTQKVNKSELPESDKLELGMQFQADSDNGPIILTVTNIDNDLITLDGNHPLAGQTLHFDIEITEVREAKESELDHGHVHGPGCNH